MSLEKSLVMDESLSTVDVGGFRLAKQLSAPPDFNSSPPPSMSRQNSSKSLGRASTADSSFDSLSPEPRR